jgi:HSP20 family protein
MSLIAKRVHGGNYPSLFDFPSVFEDFFDHPVTKSQRFLSPKVNIKETESSFYIFAELPGLTEKDIKIELDKGVLTISGEKTFDESETNSNETFLTREISSGKFSRSFRLHESVSDQGIKAKLNDGILVIELEKTEEKKKKEIPISA